jgi:hypothetical protein
LCASRLYGHSLGCFERRMNNPDWPVDELHLSVLVSSPIEGAE